MAANITVPVTIDTYLRDCLNRIINELDKLRNADAPVTEETIKDIRKEIQDAKSSASTNTSKVSKMLEEMQYALDNIYNLKETFKKYSELMQQLEDYVLPTLVNMYNDIKKLKEEMAVVKQVLAEHATKIQQLETDVANHMQFTSSKFDNIEQRLKALESK